MQENQKFIPRLLTDLRKLYQGGNTKDTKIVFKKPNIKPKIFDALFSYIYIGEIDLTDYDGFMLIELLEAADELLMNDELVLHVQKYLRDTKTDWIQENLFKFLEKIFLYDHETFESLRNYCITILLQNPQSFFDSEDFLNSDRIFLYQLLKRDDLDMEEKDSFIFSLGSSHKIDKAIISRLLPESVDTRFFQKSTTGPMFGNHDLYISDECNSNYLSMHKRENYARRIREHGHFLVEDYEVFKVTKKI
nr:1687_t:CDS:2 [Entrophospora candida]